MSRKNDETVNADGFATTELAERLSGPGSADFARELQARLEELRAGVEAEIRGGVGVGQLDGYRRVAEALASAAAVVIRAADAKARQGVPGALR